LGKIGASKLRLNAVWHFFYQESCTFRLPSFLRAKYFSRQQFSKLMFAEIMKNEAPTSKNDHYWGLKVFCLLFSHDRFHLKKRNNNKMHYE